MQKDEDVCYLRHADLVGRVDELRGVVVDVRNSDDDGDGPLLTSGSHGASQLQNK